MAVQPPTEFSSNIQGTAAVTAKATVAASAIVARAEGLDQAGAPGVAVDARATDGGDAVRGVSTGTAGSGDPHLPGEFPGDGVAGSSDAGRGVYGTSQTGAGVHGDSVDSNGVVGESANGTGAVGRGDHPDPFNVQGYGVAGLGSNIGVYAHNRDYGNAAYLSTQALAGDFQGAVRVHILEITGGGDLAEAFPVQDSAAIEPGTVMVIDDEHPGSVKISDAPYDHKVAGIVTGAARQPPGVTLASGASGELTTLALTGRVYCKAEAISNSISPGDLLTTSSCPGRAMRASDRANGAGAVLGKAMTPLGAGMGTVLVLVCLQ